MGVMPLSQARQLAQEKGVDVVQLAQTPEETIVKLIDFGKFKYLQEKQEKKQKVQKKESGPKIVRIGFITQAHDLEVRARQAEKFLNQNYQVQVDLILRGRQKAHRDMAAKKINEFLSLINVSYKKIQEKASPRGLNVLISKS